MYLVKIPPIGVFTVPVTGMWRVSFTQSGWRKTETEWANIFIFHNNQRIEKNFHNTGTTRRNWKEFGNVLSTRGRELIIEAKQGDTFHLWIDERLDAVENTIKACFEFVSL